MWRQKIGISIGNHYGLPTAEVVKIAAAAGFDAVSPEYEPGADLHSVIHTAKDLGLVIQSLHAPFGKSDAMWSSDETVSSEALEELLKALEVCHIHQIPVMVVHTWIGFHYTFHETSFGFQNFGQLVKKAQEYGVRIAFENTEGEEFLDALLEYFKGNESVGFCWDSGHELCYNHSRDLLAKYGDRLCMTHLNDNLGISRFDGEIFWTDDLHLLPYDGIADWDYNIHRLKNAKPLDILNFELNITSKPGRHENDIYGLMTMEQYMAEAFKRACRIAYRYTH